MSGTMKYNRDFFVIFSMVPEQIPSKTSVSIYQTLILTVISGVETADVTDAANPLIHLLFCVSHQVEDAIYGLDIENEAVLQVLLVERQPSIHLKGKHNFSSERIFTLH